MIEAYEVFASSRLARLRGITLALEAGLHAVVGTAADGVTLVLSVLAGRTPPERGTVRLDGVAPERARTNLVWVGRAPALPDPLRVDQAVHLAAQVRGETVTPARAVLGRLDISDLASRPLGSLRPAETKAVALAIALEADARALFFDEPFLDLEPAVAERVAHALRERAARPNAIVVVGTASEREAERLGARIRHLRGGMFVEDGRSAAPLAVFVAVSSDARALLSALAGEEVVSELESHGGSIRAAGADPVEVARAIGRAAVHAGVDLYSLDREPVS